MYCRQYESISDLVRMQALLVEGRAQTDDWRYAHIGDLMWNYFMVTCHQDPTQVIRLWLDGDRLAAYAILGEDPSFDCQILPQYEGLGIDEDALAWMEQLIAEEGFRNPGLWGEAFSTGARQDYTTRIAFLERHGFRPGERFSEVNMIRSLSEPIRDARLPAGCRLRAFAGPRELSDRAASIRDVWLPWTVGDVTDEDYARLMSMPAYNRELDIVSISADGRIAAYVNGWLDERNRVGDFGPVGAREEYRRQGYTRVALLECLRRMQARGMQRVTVSTGVGNEAAIRLYESVGFRIVNRFIEYTRPL